MSLSLSTERRAEGTVVRVAGEIDIASAPDLESYLLHTLLNGSARLSVDLAGVRFCDCAGLGALLTVARTARSMRAGFRVVGTSRRVDRLLDLTGTRATLGAGDVDGSPPVGTLADGSVGTVR